MYIIQYIPVSHVGPEYPTGHTVQLFISAMSQAEHNSLQQFAPENPSGHAVQVFSSLTSQAEHAALQTARRVFN